MMKIGAHLSISGGLLRMAQDAVRIGAGTLQCFIRNPRGARSKAVIPDETAAFRAILSENRLTPIVVHAAYTMNLCSENEQTRSRSAEMLREDLLRMADLPGNLYNLHPGSRISQPAEIAVRQIADAVNRALPMPGIRSSCSKPWRARAARSAAAFRSFRTFFSLIDDPARAGVCMDSCHMHDAGYDIVNDLDGVLAEFDRTVGLSRLYAFHINDSLNPRGSRRDRHAMCGEGQLGLEAIRRILTHPALRHLPFILETPTDTDGHAAEIALLKSLCGETL